MLCRTRIMLLLGQLAMESQTVRPLDHNKHFIQTTNLGYHYFYTTQLKIILYRRYTIQYTVNGVEVTEDITKDNRDAVKELSNLSPATNYVIKTTIVVPDEFGGKGDPAEITVFTG